jgi:hypothetical protein
VKALHSRYDPQGEAERYLAAVSIHPETRCFILIEPGLGYMIPVLVRRFPAALIIALHVETGGGGREEGAAHWDPSLALGVEDFLERELGKAAPGGLGAESIKIIEWRPARDRYGGGYVGLMAAAAAVIRRFDAERRTIRAFGRRWVRNFFRNLRLLGGFPVFRELQTPILVTGAGPSLEKSLPLIRELQEGGNCFIIASSSSAMALLYRGTAPDLVLSIDGGPWALFHLYELFRNGAGSAAAPAVPPPVLAAAFSASLPSQCGDLPILWISDGSLWQGLILRGLGIPHLVLPQRGTVTAAALDLAFTLGRGEVCIAGMDLDTRDIRTHVRPYGFDRFWREGASRFRTEYGQYFSRSFAVKEGGSHRVYAEWFAARLASYPGRLRTLGENNPLFRDLPQLRMPPPRAGKAPDSGFHRGAPEIIRAAGAGTLYFRALDILKGGLEDPKTGGALRGELGPLLFGDRENPDSGELWTALESLGEVPVPGGTAHG